MKHFRIQRSTFLVMVMMCFVLASLNVKGQTLGDTYYFNGSTQASTNFLYNSTSQIGIGTTSPTSGYYLDVAGNALIQSNLHVNGTIYGSINGTGAFSALTLLGLPSSSTGIPLGVNSWGDVVYLNGIVPTYASHNSFSNASGNASHIEELEVGNASGNSSKMFLGGGWGGLPISWLAYPTTSSDFRFYGTAPAAQIEYQPWGGRMQFKFSSNSPSFQDVVNWNEVLSIGGGGNVGINIIDQPGYALAVQGSVIIGDNINYNPAPNSYKLQVDGMIGCREMRVCAGSGATWCDYVFDRGYKLTSLKDLEKYILENHHLPDVPSSAEVEKDGFKVGEISTVLLKKVEELTLYTIQLQKQIDALTKELKDAEISGN